jgi:hypothetical protein
VEPDLGVPREEMLGVLGESLAKALLDDASLEECHQQAVEFCSEEEFHIVLWEADMCLWEECGNNIEAAKKTEHNGPYLDRADRCSDLRDKLDFYGAKLVLEGVYGRAMDTAVVHPSYYDFAETGSKLDRRSAE